MKHLRVYFSLIIVVAVALTGGNMAEAQVGKPQGLVYPNVASEKELSALPHMNPAIVKVIVEERPFTSMSELNALLSKSLNTNQLTDLYVKLFEPINLNNATEAEIMLIPGMGKRMLREFLEYRPYRTMAQFRKEIGKYVDDKEVARLEQYVFVPINLNRASDEDILSIPGIGKRMLREFKEYRPYTNIEQFRKEIGKYIDKKEAARLERYVTLN